MTAIDNVVAYQEGRGEVGGDNGFLRLSLLPEIKTYADLKGKELSVGAR